MPVDPKEAPEGYVAVESGSPLSKCIDQNGEVCCFRSKCEKREYPDAFCLKSSRKDKYYVVFHKCGEV